MTRSLVSHTSNAMDCALSVLSTWFGQPRAAGAVRVDPDDPLSLLRGETGGRDRIETWIGARFEYIGPDASAYPLIIRKLTESRHGAAAVIVNGWPPHLGSGTHAWNAFNDQGRVLWFDVKVGGQPGPHPPYPEVYGVWALFVDRNWTPNADYP